MLGLIRKLFRSQQPASCSATSQNDPDQGVNVDAPASPHGETSASADQSNLRPETLHQMPDLWSGSAPLPEPPRNMPDLVASSDKEYSTIGLVYRDAEGERTERIVTISAIVSDAERRDIFGYCHLRGAFRQFRADRIEGFFDPETGEAFSTAHLNVHTGPVPVYSNEIATSQPTPRTLQDVADRYLDRLEAIGWAVVLNREAGGDQLSCHHRSKRGTPLKRPAIELRYDPLVIEEIAEADGSIGTYFTGFRERPWVLRAEERPTRTWSQLAPALTAFLEIAGV